MFQALGDAAEQDIADEGMAMRRHGHQVIPAALNLTQDLSIRFPAPDNRSVQEFSLKYLFYGYNQLRLILKSIPC